MESILLILDESGAKGYDDNQERERGEFGVMAGFAIPTSKAEPFMQELEVILEPFQANGKLHITGLPDPQQESLRECIFSYLSQCQAPWFYEAIYVQGFHEIHKSNKGFAEQAHSERSSHVRLPNNPVKESLHGELFLGAFSKGLAMVTDSIGPRFHLKVITDRVDQPILKLFQSEADRLLRPGGWARKEETGFDLETRQVLKGAIETNIVDISGAMGDFSNITYEIECEDNVLTLVADVLANSVRYYLSQFQAETPGIAINSSDAIKDHPLAHLIYGAYSSEESFNIPDMIFGHPDAQVATVGEEDKQNVARPGENRNTLKRNSDNKKRGWVAVGIAIIALVVFVIAEIVR